MSRHEDLRENERTIGQLVADASHDIQGIIKSEVALAKAEVSEGAKVMGKGVGLLVGAGVLAVFGLTFLFHTLARVIGVWLPVWAGYLIVTVILFIVAAALAMLGRNALNTAKPRPEKAIAQAQLTVDAVKDATGS
ncbi:phage holin family protein [Nostocoides sp. F2B08]|uniref:phage holin family protein n=1 Tax=Nostocoides sp. F2B08 TaxID=2653936 RepID=UPI0012631C1D|nr:phage holin family protein [Tetrasphaera sp. F2B08]KAB7746546.1 phage holin family protein [Tetrasphaera sp. F2B08]